MGSMIGLVGYAGSGKDTVADILVEEYGYRKITFASKIVEMGVLIDPPAPEGLLSFKAAVEMHGWDFAKTYPDYRQFIQKLGSAAREIFGEWIWIDAALNPPEQSGLNKVVFTDARRRNEIDFIDGNGGKIIRVNRPGVGPVNDHITESEWTGFQPHYTINNDGTLEDLKEKIDWAWWSGLFS